MEQFKKVTVRIKGETYEHINASNLTAGAEVDKAFETIEEQKQRLAFLEEQVLQFQKEKRLLLELTNNSKVILDILNSFAVGLNISFYQAYDELPHATIESALNKQKQRVDAIRHYTK